MAFITAESWHWATGTFAPLDIDHLPGFQNRGGYFRLNQTYETFNEYI